MIRIRIRIICRLKKKTVSELILNDHRKLRIIAGGRSLIITKKEYFYKKKYLEPLLNDYRKLRIISGGEAASHHKRNVKFPERMAWAGAWAHNNSNTNSNINSNTNHCSNNISNES